MEIEVRLLVPDLAHGRVAQWESACLTRKRLLVRVQPCPCSRRIAQAAERLSDTEEVAGSTPAPPTHVTVAQPVERSPETRGVAGSIPAGHIRLRSSRRQSSRLLPGRLQVRRLPGPLTHLRKDCHRRGIPSRKRVGSRALGVRLPLLPPASFRRGRVGTTRDCYSREAGSSPAAGALTTRPRGRTGDDAGPSTRKLRVRVPPGVLSNVDWL